MGGFDIVFQPLQVAGLTLPNRIVRTAHGTLMPWVDRSDALIDYHVARARGGVGMSILETSSVHPSAPRVINSHNDDVIPGYEKISTAVHRHGMKLFQQLWHGGSSMRDNPLGGPTWSASDIPNPVRGIVPMPMTQIMIDDVVAGFTSAAGRCQRGGLDGVEIHAAHGYLVGQFLSPALNRREDGYGGSFDNRNRFLLEILAAVRSTVGPNFPISVRLSASDEIEQSITPADAARTARLIEPLTDIVNVSLGSYHRFYRMLASADGGTLGYELPSSEVVTSATTAATIVTGRIMTLDLAAHILQTGQADLVSMVRALIADPDLVRKARDGRAGEVRPCIGTNLGCVGGMRENNFGCVVNPWAGREASTPVESTAPTAEPLLVMVVGGGPAGLEAARSAASAGHTVELYELRRALGGQLAIAAAAPYRADLGAVISWWESELRRLGVKVMLGTAVDPDLVAHIDPDVVVVATGATPRRDGFNALIPGFDLPGLERIRTSWDVFGFGGGVEVGTHAVVYDDASTWEAISVVEELLRRGSRVTLVTRHDTFGSSNPEPFATTLAARERLANNPNFTLVASAMIREINATDVKIGFLGGTRRERLFADLVVTVGYNRRERELGEYLAAAKNVAVHIIGDAGGGNSIRQATADGSHVAGALAKTPAATAGAQIA